MTYDAGLAERLREALRDQPKIVEKKMFGGLAFMVRGHMLIGIVGETMMARVGPAAYEDALARPFVREMDFTGRPMKGFLYVDPPGFDSDTDCAYWVSRCLDFNASLPAK